MLTLSMSAFGGKADMTRTVAVCPLMTHSGHESISGMPLLVTHARR